MRDVVVTGLGAVTPIGRTVADTWSALLEGTCGAGPVSRFDPEAYSLRSTIACEARYDFDDRAAVDAKNAGAYARNAVAAAEEALDDAGLVPGSAAWRPERVGTAIATGVGGVPEFEAASERVASGRRPSPRFSITYLPNLAAGHASIAFDARGPSRTPATACAAGAHAVGSATDDVRLGRADVMVAGGTERSVTPVTVSMFDAMRALSTRNDAPERSSRPFDADRDGFVMSEGAGILVLEAREHAVERGATPYAALAGQGVTSDAHHPTRPAPDAAGLSAAMERALADADLEPGDVDHVNAHATSTPRGDAHESRALERVFGDRVPPVTSVKGQLGHALGAAGALEAVVAVETVASGVLPPTINYETPDADCDVPVVEEPRDADPGAVLSNAAGFGGTNGALAFTAPS